MKTLVSGVVAFVCLLFSALTCLAEGVHEGGTRLGYSIQVGAFAEVKNAERMISILREKGIEAYYIRKEEGGYAVRTGDFPTYDAARKTACQYAEDGKIDSFFITVPRKVSVIGKVRVGPRRDAEKPNPKKVPAETAVIVPRNGEDAIGITLKRRENSAAVERDTDVPAGQAYSFAGLNLIRPAPGGGGSICLDGPAPRDADGLGPADRKWERNPLFQFLSNFDKCNICKKAHQPGEERGIDLLFNYSLRF